MSFLVAAERCSYIGLTLRLPASATGRSACACFSAASSLCECCFAAMVPIWSAIFSQSLFPLFCSKSISSFLSSDEPTSSTVASGSFFVSSGFVSDAFGLHGEVI